MLQVIEESNFRALQGVLDIMSAVGSVRKSSKAVSSHWLLDIYQSPEPRILVLTATLYYEHFIERRLRREGLVRNRRALRKEIKTLASTKTIPESLEGDMLAVVDLRNEFVHNLHYDVAEWNPCMAPFLSASAPRMPKPRHLRELKNFVLLKILLVETMQELHRCFPWLHLEDVPKPFRKRSNNSLNPTRLRRAG